MKNDILAAVISFLSGCTSGLIFIVAGFLFPLPGSNFIRLLIAATALAIIVNAIILLLKMNYAIEPRFQICFICLVLFTVQLLPGWVNGPDKVYLAIVVGFWVAVLFDLCIFRKFGLSQYTSAMEKYTASVEQLLRKSVVLSATCFAFKQGSACEDETELVLILNTNFGQDGNGSGWWLAPGGHVQLSEEMLPEDVAKDKTEAEAGITVELLKPRSYSEIDFSNCKSKIPPHAVYYLGIEPTAKCYKQDHHEAHCDFTYIAKVLTVLVDDNNPRFDLKKTVLWVKLRKGQSGQEIDTAVKNKIRDWYREKGLLPPATLFPDDFSGRLTQAVDAYWRISGEKGEK